MKKAFCSILLLIQLAPTQFTGSALSGFEHGQRLDRSGGTGAKQQSASEINDIAGIWEGRISISSAGLDLTLKLSTSTQGGPIGRLDSPDQGVSDLPLEGLKFHEGVLRFEISLISAVYEGTLSADRMQINGMWKQAGSIPLSFNRLSKGGDSKAPGPLRMRNISFASRVKKLEDEISNGKTDAVDRFWKEIAATGAPWVERIRGSNKDVLLTFIWRAPAETKNVVVSSEVGDSDPAKDQLAQIQKTGIWHKSYRVRSDLRFTYQFFPNDSLSPWEKRESAQGLKDPFNPQYIIGAGSVAELPAAEPQPWLVTNITTPVGKISRERVRSEILGNERNVYIYTPPGYRESGSPCAVLILFDGASYLTGLQVMTTINNLTAKKRVQPLLSVLVDNASPDLREKELVCNDSFVKFLSDELIPWIRKRYNVSPDPAKTIVGGFSAGGLAAAYAALLRPDLFGNVLSQSGSFWMGKQGSGSSKQSDQQWLANRFAQTKRLPIRFYIEAGMLENRLGPNNEPSLLDSNRRLREILKAKGYTLFYREFSGGHDPSNWRGGLASGLLALESGAKTRR